MSPGSVASANRKVSAVLVPPALATPLGSSQSLPFAMGGLLTSVAGTQPGPLDAGAGGDAGQVAGGVLALLPCRSPSTSNPATVSARSPLAASAGVGAAASTTD